MSPAPTYARPPAIASDVTRLMLPPLGGRSSRNRSIGVPGAVKLIARSVRSVLAENTASPEIGEIEISENGTLPASVRPMKTCVSIGVEMNTFPLLAWTAVTVVGGEIAPLGWTVGLIVKRLTRELSA